MIAPASIPPRSGIGRFELMDLLGSGGMGTVYEARERETGARIAIKMLREREGSALFRFKQEFRVLADLSHPNLVRFGELFEDAGRFYLTMELVEGQDFLDHVRPGALARRSPGLSTTQIPDITLIEPIGRPTSSAPSVTRSGVPAPVQPDVHPGRLDEARLRQALRQLCSGLMALHAAGLVHRDLKPRNVLVTDAGKVVLLDFGLAVNPQQALDRGAEFVGTVAYMAPEQANAEAVTAAADWYALGVVLYEALTGRLPYEGSILQTLALKQTWPPAHPTAYLEDAPADLCALCMQLLHPDPRRRPDGEQIARGLGLDPDAERGRAGFRAQLQFTRAPFVGRRGELEILRSALGRAQTRRGALVRIMGDSGVGKSALVRRLIDELSAAGSEARVLSGRCYERETVPYRGVDRVVDALAQHLRDAVQRDEPIHVPRGAALLGQVFPVLRALPAFARGPASRLAEVDPYEARRVAFHALRDLLGALADERPLLVHIDDAQWMDAESTALLAHLALGVDAPRMLLVLAQRPLAPGAPDPLAELVAGSAEVTQLVLGPLTPEDSERLAASLAERLGRGASLAPASVAQQSGGHPLFIHELLMRGEGAADGAMSLDQALSSRIAALDPACRKLLELVALAPSAIVHGVVRAASDLGADRYPWVLSTLRAENFVTFHDLAVGGEVQPYHDRIRELVVMRMGDDERQRGHERLGMALEEQAPDALDVLAYHFLRSGFREKAARYTRHAGERALAKLAFEQAAYLFREALTVESSSAVRAELQARLGRALAYAGRGLDAAEAYLRAASATQGLAALELRRCAGEQLLRSGHLERGLAILSDVLRPLGVRIPAHRWRSIASVAASLARVQVGGLAFTERPAAEVTAEQKLRLDTHWTLATGLSLIDTVRATEFQARSLMLALAIGERDGVLRSMALLAVSLGLVDGVERRIGERLMARARELAADAPSPENDAWIALDAGITALARGDFPGCERSCEKSEALFRDHCTGASWEVVTSQAFVLWSLAYQGKLPVVAERLPAVLAQARARGDRYALATLLVGPLHLVGLAADDPTRVRRDCAEVAEAWSSEMAAFQRICALYSLAQTDLYEGRGDAAWERVQAAWGVLERAMLMRVQIHRIDFVGLRGRAALARAIEEPRRRGHWIARARADARRLAGERLAFGPAMGALLDAAIAWHQERRPDTRRRLLEHARDGLDRAGFALHAETARLALGIAAHDDRARRAAQEALGDLGVRNPTAMLRLWLPGVADA